MPSSFQGSISFRPFSCSSFLSASIFEANTFPSRHCALWRAKQTIVSIPLTSSFPLRVSTARKLNRQLPRASARYPLLQTLFFAFGSGQGTVRSGPVSSFSDSLRQKKKRNVSAFLFPHTLPSSKQVHPGHLHGKLCGSSRESTETCSFVFVDHSPPYSVLLRVQIRSFHT